MSPFATLSFGQKAGNSLSIPSRANYYNTHFLNILNLLHALYSENPSVQQNCHVHKEPAIPDVVEVILKVFVNKICPVCTQLPQSGDAWYNGQPLPLSWSIRLNNEWHFRAGPTSDISPLITFKIWGNSSRLSFLRILPSRVIL